MKVLIRLLITACVTLISGTSFAQQSAHLLVFTNNSGEKTPYFVYQGQKQFIDNDCRIRQPSLNPFAAPRLRIENTSDWTTGANQAPLGGPDRPGSTQLSCDQMATIAAAGGQTSNSEAKLLLYRKADGTSSVYFVYQNTKQWIGTHPGSGVACRTELEQLLKHEYLNTATSWQQANEIGGPDRANSLSCDAMLTLARAEDGSTTRNDLRPLAPDTPHLLVFTNQSGTNTAYFVYQEKKQFLDGSCSNSHSELDPFRSQSLRVVTTSDWNGIANKPPSGGPDRSDSAQFSCTQMLALVTNGSNYSSSEAKLMRYSNGNTVSIYFSYQNKKQWIGSNRSAGLSCRTTLEQRLQNHNLPNATDWQQANAIGGPNVTEALSCSAMLAITTGGTGDLPDDRSDLGTDSGRINFDAPVAPGGEVDRQSPFGINLTAETYWSSAWTFVDVMHKATPWTPSPATGALELDASGWVKRLKPQQTANLNVYRNVAGNYPAGEYTVLYDGEGTLEYGRGASLIENSRRNGFEKITVNPNNGRVDITLKTTNPSNYLRGLRVIMPEGSCETDKAKICQTDSQCSGATRCLPFTETYRERLFHPNFLKNLQKFPVIRFMDWGAVNHISTSNFKDPREDPAVPSKRNWNNRILPDHHPWQTWFQAGREVPYEVMMRLANDVKADAWINVPHGVDDNYVRQLARLVREQLDPGRRIYLELANEMWNYAFKQGASLSNARSGIGPMEATLERSVEVFKIWEQEFGGTSRLVRVLAPQAGWPDAGRQLMQRAKDKAYLPYIDAIAIAPYFGHEWACDKNDQFAAKTVDRIVDEIQNGDMMLAIDRMKEYGAIARQFNKRLIAYEGGQHFALLGRNAAAASCANGAVNKDTPQWAEKIYELNNHPGMRRIYNNYLVEWRKAGGEEFVFYNYTGLWNNSGAWGFFQSNRLGAAASSPKFQGALDFRNFNPKWW